MQLKGLVRFFTIILIIYSIYQLSFTWFVHNHEKKMEARANSFVRVNYTSPAEKFPGNKDSQAVYQEVLNRVKADRLKRLLDSTKDVTVTYSLTGPVSYQKAKEEELNLGLDLQGGMNVTLEVEMTIDDPKSYTAPWTVKLTQPLVLDSELLDYYCLENEKSWGHMVK